MKISGAGEGLTNNARTDQLAAADDELSVGFVAKEQLSKGGNCKRIKNP